MAHINCIIVDDDVFSTRIVSGYIGRTNGVSITQTFNCAVDAINFLCTQEGKQVNLVFLDIEMPDLSGIDFMRAADLKNKEVIIYSSQKKYALESYEYDVCDYLLKPVSYARFIKAIGKARSAISGRGEQSEPREGEDFIVLKDNRGTSHKIVFRDIVLVSAEQNYVSISTTNGEILVHQAMKKLLDLMPETLVCRVHRSFAIGLKYVSKVEKDLVSIEAGAMHHTLPLSRSYGQQLRKTLKDSRESDD